MTNDAKFLKDAQGNATMAQMQFSVIRRHIDNELNRTNPTPSQDAIDALRRIDAEVLEFHQYWVAEIDRLDSMTREKRKAT